ncbi:MAG: hypothetical protein Q7J84_08060 [Sulfuricaulis sp.]|nr:hypothetical protein [Sulfuricaulis sp.]
MATTGQPSTFSELYTELLNAVREATTITATTTIAKRYINRALHDMHIDSDFPWAIRTATLLLHAPYTTGTVTITQGGTAWTGDSTVWTTVNAFNQDNARTTGKLTITGTDIYTISTVAASSIVTNERFVAADVAASTYTYYEDEYALASDFWQPVDKRQFTDAIAIELIGSRDFYRRYPRNSTLGTPNTATLIDLGPSGSTAARPRIVFHPVPSAAMLVPYRYLTSNLAVTTGGVASTDLSADTDEPIVPLRYRHAIVLHALAFWYRDRKDDTRSREVKAEYTDLIRRIRQDTMPTDDHPRLVPNLSRYRAGARRTGRARYDIHGHFDRLE